MTVISIMPVIWLSLILAAIFAEALSEWLVAIWIAPASAAALICGIFGVSLRHQITVFIVCAALLITAAQTIRSAVSRRERHNRTDTDIE